MALPRPLISRSRVSMSIRMSATIFASRAWLEDLLHRAPALLELRPGQVGQALGLDLEPLVDLGLRRDVLVDVAGLVAQIQHHAVLHRLVEFVGVDVRPKDLDALLLVLLQERRAGEADEHRPRQDGLHRLVQLAGLGAVALVHEHEEVALGMEILGQAALDLRDEGLRRPCRSGRLRRGRICGSASRPATASAALSTPHQVARRCWCGRCPR